MGHGLKTPKIFFKIVFYGFHNKNNQFLFQAALSCYAHATNKLPENSPLTVGVNLEIVEALEKLEETESKERYLKDAVDKMENSLDTRIYCSGLLASNYIDNGKKHLYFY